MGRRQTYREGDTIRIIRPRFISRVGYPQTAGDLYKGFLDHPKLGEAAALLGIVEWPQALGTGRTAKEFAMGCATAANRARGFGGKERSLHYYDGDFTYYAGTVEKIIRKRVVKTGTYFAPCGGMSDDPISGREYWYEPGGLNPMFTHVLLLLQSGYEIEATDVEPA